MQMQPSRAKARAKVDDGMGAVGERAEGYKVVVGTQGEKVVAG